MSDLPAFHTWMTDAACTEYDPEFWWPGNGGDNRRVFEICDACPVKKQCLQFAIDNDEREGIWGGVAMSTHSRQRNKRAVA